MVINKKEKSFDSKFELPNNDTRYSLDSSVPVKSPNFFSSLGAIYSKKRNSDLPERPRSRQHDPPKVKIETTPEKQKNKNTTIQIPSFHAITEPSSLLKKRFKSFVQDNLVKKYTDIGNQEILEACTNHINVYDSAYKKCIKSNNGLREWTSKHSIISCHTTTTPHDIAFARQKGATQRWYIEHIFKI